MLRAVLFSLLCNFVRFLCCRHVEKKFIKFIKLTPLRVVPSPVEKLIQLSDSDVVVSSNVTAICKQTDTINTN